MIPVKRSPEPSQFDTKCRKAGKAWLKLQARPLAGRPKDYWSQFRPDLCNAFKSICAYEALFIGAGGGCVDHFEPVSNTKLIYEWSNYRYANARVNSRKGIRGSADILDPFEVRPGWFEILLPSLQMRVTDRVPAPKRARAEATLRLLGLDHHEQVVASRAEFYRLYREGKLSLEALREWAPLIAEAIDNEQLAR
ncbi:MAG: hypothetical protein IPG63_02095 [Xanthomonadales bacterium]|nr:hypothetical protein [Xanthomonadales bacterium]MBK7145142.1 hypothetical protein [Xanthomonadales bacterium]MCC6561743.1 hypothetical protein [Xanthomonadales bacterium]